MNKADFVDLFAKRAKLPKSQAESMVDTFIELIQKSVSTGEEVKFVGFGTFDQATRKSRNGHNPKTGTSIVIPASRVPRFRPGKDFKDLVRTQQ